MIGDVFQLGNTSYRILKVEADRVRVEERKARRRRSRSGSAGAGPDGRAFRGRVRLRETLSELLLNAAGESVEHAWRAQWNGCAPSCISTPRRTGMCEYLLHAQIALGFLPTQQELGIERFFDESGAMQLIIHSPLGSRINKAWGLALRKRFCRSFNFELQAAATEDNIVLSLSTSHSFRLMTWAVPAFLVGPRRAGAGLLDARCSACAGAGPPPRRWRCRACPVAEGGAADPAHAQRGPARHRLPRTGRVWRTSWANARYPTIRWSRRHCTIACTKPWTWMASWPAAAPESARHIHARDLTAPRRWRPKCSRRARTPSR